VPLVEELIGLATMLIPEPKLESTSFTLEDWETDLTVENIKTMKGMIADIRANTTCPRCLAHCDAIEKELAELERKYPTYQRVNKLRRQLRQLLDLIKPEGELPILPESQS